MSSHMYVCSTAFELTLNKLAMGRIAGQGSQGTIVLIRQCKAGHLRQNGNLGSAVSRDKCLSRATCIDLAGEAFHRQLLLPNV